MATSFPSRPYTSNIARAGPSGPSNAFPSAPYNAPTAYNASQKQAQSAGTFGATSGAAATQQQREAQRLDRERQERVERERREAEQQATFERLSDEHREEINEAFSLFDLDKDAHIDYHELKVALRALGFDVPKADLLDVLTRLGIPASTLAGTLAKSPVPAEATFTGPHRLLLSHAHFTYIAADKLITRDPREEILRAFDLFDQGNKGRIDVQDLRRVAQELGEGLSEEELVAMVEEFDIRGEGGIGREEFIGICLGG